MVTFENKTLHVDTSKQISTNRQTTSSSSNSSVRNTCVFTTHTAALQNQIGTVTHQTCIWWNLWVIFSPISLEMCQSPNSEDESKSEDRSVAKKGRK